jgi:oligopeptide/dipeptide ABC transporter ATP-binding protein
MAADAADPRTGALEVRQHPAHDRAPARDLELRSPVRAPGGGLSVSPASAPPEREPLLELRELRTEFRTEAGLLRAVDGVSFVLRSGETLALVGESGSGKSVTALSILRLVAEPPGRVAGGEIRFRGRDLLRLSPRELRAIRGREISMIFQEPMTSLNPVFTCGRQVAEVLELHQGLARAAARAQAIELLRRVGIAAPEHRVDEYPHQVSGGMRQRVMIAMALACRPAVLIADEPTTALDVTIQAQILELLADLKRELGMAVLLITHDLGVVAETADRVAVMYAGQVVELADVRALFSRPLHPYTAGLLASLPRLGSARGRLRAISGQVPDPLAFPGGCRFHPRCPVAIEKCRSAIPPLEAFPDGRSSRCWRAAELLAGTLEPSAGRPT